MRDKVLSRLKGLVRPGETVICAVSGGADSVAMLHVLLRLRDELGITVEAAHFNHRLRGAESDRDEEFVRTLCQAWDVRLHTGSGDVFARAGETGESVEEAARKLRYAFFDSLGAAVATAHTADDNLETVLLNLLRGTGLKGLCGIPETRAGILRPMLSVTRAEIEAYLSENSLSHVEDSTNRADDCVRNRLRHQVIPLLRAENPSLSTTVLRMSALLSQDEAYLQALADDALLRAKAGSGYECALLRALPDALRTRALRTMLSEIHAPKLSGAHIRAVDGLLFSADPSARLSLPGGYTAERQYELLFLRRETGQETFSPVRLSVGGSVLIPALSLRIRAERVEAPAAFSGAGSVLCVKDSGVSEYLLRPRQTGDSILLPGGRKTLKKYMIDRKIPASVRERIPVVTDGSRVLAVYPDTVSTDARPAPGTLAVAFLFETIK